MKRSNTTARPLYQGRAVRISIMKLRTALTRIAYVLIILSVTFGIWNALLNINGIGIIFPIGMMGLMGVVAWTLLEYTPRIKARP